MKRLNYMIGYSILIVLILVLFTIVPASADKPVIERFRFEVDTVYEDCGFPIPAHIEGGYQSKAFFDNDGVYRGGANEPWGERRLP